MLQSKKRSWKTLLISLVAVLSITVVAGCGSKDDKVVATYEGGEITASEYDFEQRMMLLFQPDMAQLLEMEDFRNYLIKQEIAYEYLASKADKTAKDAAKKTAEEQLANMKTTYGEEGFKSNLATQKIDEKDFKDYLIRIYTVMESEKAKVSDEAVKQEFEANKENYITASVRHILIGLTDAEGNTRTDEEALKLANELKVKLDAGEDFATLVKEYSDDGQQNIENGGLYANEAVGNWVAEFKEKAISLPLNTISEPVKTDYGYHIMRVEARTEKAFTDLSDEEKDQIKSALAAQKLDEFMSGELEEEIIKKIELPAVKKAEESTEGTDAGTDGTNSGTTDVTTPDATDGSNNSGK